MSKPTVYIETTVIGHIAAWDQADVLVAARQLQSRRWSQFLYYSFFSPRPAVIAADYEVLDLQVTVATIFDIFLSLHFLFAF